MKARSWMWLLQDPRHRLSCTEVARLSGDLIQHHLSRRAAPPLSPSAAQLPLANGGSNGSHPGAGAPQGVSPVKGRLQLDRTLPLPGGPGGTVPLPLQDNNSGKASSGRNLNMGSSAPNGGSAASGGETIDGMSAVMPLSESSRSMLLMSGSGAMASSNGSGMSRDRFSGAS